MTEESNVKVLYIAFSDLSLPAHSGSTLRPRKMLEAFQKVSADVRYADGARNNREQRKKAYLTVKEWLKTWTPDLCYIELPSGPLFFFYDVRLIRMISRHQIPIGAFYRDAYWKFGNIFPAVRSLEGFVKQSVIRILQERDLILFKKKVDTVFFPSELMASYFSFQKEKELPPGCEEIPLPADRVHREINVVYSGGATKRYGLPMLIRSARKLHSENDQIRLTVICPEAGWEEFIRENDGALLPEDEGWLTVRHISVGKEMQEIYNNSDISVIPIEENEYHEFAFPVKLVDYLSHEIPMVVTNCRVQASFVRQNDIGIVVDDNEDALTAGIKELADDPEKRQRMKRNCHIAKEKNTWEKRAEKAIKDILSKSE